MEDVIKGITDLTQLRIGMAGDGPLPTEQAVRQWFYQTSPGFRTDVIFHDIFPIVYGLIWSEIMIKRQSAVKNRDTPVK